MRQLYIIIIGVWYSLHSLLNCIALYMIIFFYTKHLHIPKYWSDAAVVYGLYFSWNNDVELSWWALRPTSSKETNHKQKWTNPWLCASKQFNQIEMTNLLMHLFPRILYFSLALNLTLWNSPLKKIFLYFCLSVARNVQTTRFPLTKILVISRCP